MRDVAHVLDGSAPQTNVVHVDGQRSALMTVLKSGAASTLAIVEGVKGRLPQLLTGLPDALKVDLIGDQSVLVKASVKGVVSEGATAALRSEEHTSELQSLMRISYAVFCLKKKNNI